MKLLPCVGGVIALMASLSLSAADFTRTEIRQMHQAGVKMKLPSDSISRQPYVIPETMSPSQLVEAESIDFSNLALFSVPPWLGKFSQIRYLDLSNTKITTTGLVQALRGMPKLDTLNLAKSSRLFNESGSSLAGLWPHLPNLSTLDLSGLSASPAQIGDLSALSSLHELNLSHNRLGNDISTLGVARLNGLRTLSLSSSGLTRSPLGALPVGGLRSLDLSHNSIASLPFIDMPSLESLKIGGNSGIRIDEAFGGLFAMASLKVMDVDDNIRLPEGLKQKFERMKLAALKPIYQAHAKRYQINSNGTVSDNKTGLMWKQCSEGQLGRDCRGGEAKRYTWQQALALKGSRFAGYNDWRVPTIDELRTLVFCSNGTPAEEAWDNGCKGKNNRNGEYQSPTINQTAFPNTASSWYWSSSRSASYSYRAWYVYFYNGNDYTDNQSYAEPVRLVRGGQ